MMAVKFEGWLAALLGQSETEVESLLRSTMALHFLIAWSLFESKCFGGCQSFAKLDEFADRLVNKEAFVAANVSGASEHFHKRYQEASLYKPLQAPDAEAKVTEDGRAREGALCVAPGAGHCVPHGGHSLPIQEQHVSWEQGCRKLASVRDGDRAVHDFHAPLRFSCGVNCANDERAERRVAGPSDHVRFVTG